jgi:hypothetical protein
MQVNGSCVLAGIIGVVFLANPFHALAVGRNHSGIYGNVRYIAKADDYVGARIEVRQSTATKVVFQLCEGSCSEPQTYTAKIEGDRISFGYMVIWSASNGNHGADDVVVSGRFVKRGLMLKVGEAEAELLPRSK